jgi:hypothetical protein
MNKNTKVDFLRELRDNKDKENMTIEERTDPNLNLKLYVNVLIKDQKYKIFCGEGNQKLRWLTDVAIYRYQEYTESKCGMAYSIKLENGSLCDLDDRLNTVLQNNENVWVLLKEEYEMYLESQQKKASRKSLKFN